MNRSIVIFASILLLASASLTAQTLSRYTGRWRVVDAQSIARRTGGMELRTPRETLMRVFGGTEIDFTTRFLLVHRAAGSDAPLPDTIGFGRVYRAQIPRSRGAASPGEESAEGRYEGPDEDIDLFDLSLLDLLGARGRTIYLMVGRGNDERIAYDDGSQGAFRIIFADGDRIGLFWSEGACLLLLERAA